MSNRSDDLLVLDIIESIEAILVIGEAAGNLSLSFQEQHSEIPWHQIIGMRNRLIHGYFGISLKIIWHGHH